MKIELMQNLDRYAGQFLCRILQFLCRILQFLCRILSFFSHTRRTPVAEVNNIVIVKMFGMGSIILLSPMIRLLKERFPRARITFVTISSNCDIPRLYDLAYRICVIRRSSLIAFLVDTVCTIVKLRKLRPEVAIDAEFFSRYTALLCFFSGARYRSGFYSRDVYRGTFLDYHAYFNPYRHMVRNGVELAAGLLGFSKEIDQCISTPQISATAHEKAGRFADSLSSGRPIILLNPNVSDTSAKIDRSWPLERFAAFARSLTERGYTAAFTGSPDDNCRIKQVVDMCGSGAVSLAGEMNIEELLALMTRSFLLVTNDSGPLHMAVSVDLPTFSFFGTESPVIFGHSTKLHQVFYRELACSPCLSVFNYKRGKCEFDSRCLKEISLQEVLERFDGCESDLREHYASRTETACRA